MNSGANPPAAQDDHFCIEEVGLESPLLTAVIRLHAAGKSKLGPFPQGAFEDHARQKLILAAVAGEGSVAGYLLYRVARSANRASIVHLTASEQFRGKGVARLLVERLKERTRHLLGISLRCRRDYDIEDMWQSFGFTVRNTKQGRGADGAALDYWWFDHNHDDLWSQAAAREENAERVLTAIDANVFFDLTDDRRPHAEDSQVLEADWLQDSIQLCVTPEIFNEIHRSSNEEEKRRGRQAVERFLLLKTDDSVVRKLEAELAPHFKGATFANDISDMRQVAHAIVAQVPFLVTRDKPMLERGNAIYEKYGLSILHPTDLINRCDVLRRETEYRPSRLEGSSWREQLLVADEIEALVPLFQHSATEKRGAFEQLVRRFLALPTDWASKVVRDGSKAPAVYFVHSTRNSCSLEIPILRHTNHALAGTLLRHLIHEITREAGTHGHKIITVKDRELSHDAVAALTELGFVPDSGAWWKISIYGMATRQELAAAIQRADIPLSLKERLAGAIVVADGAGNEAGAMRLEHLFHPAKLTSSELPCYIVSIRPSWAEHFFDIAPGGQTRMDLNEKLHLGIEGAYYCSAKNKHLTAPGRILWYVSGTDSMSVKACSHLEERFIESPRQLYSRFRHLGVYTWKHVLETVHDNADQPLMAFRFSKTERFRRPVTLAELRRLEVPQPQNPRRIDAQQFEAIYKLGMQL
jgi:GNAT superfamily N-acetyltransferase